MAKSRAKESRQVVRAREREQRAHRVDPERWPRLLIIAAVVAAVAIAGGFIAYGYWDSEIRPLNKTVLQVGDIEISLGHLERRMELYKDQDPNYSDENIGPHTIQLPDIVMGELEREALLITGAPDIGLTVTDEELSEEIRTRVGAGELTEPDEFARMYRNAIDESHLHEDEYRQMVTAAMLENKGVDYFTFLAPDSELQLQYRRILLTDEDAANAAVADLQSGGTEFEDLAQIISLDQGTREDGGFVDWTLSGQLPSVEIEEFLTEAEPGDVSDVFDVNGQLYIVQLVQRDEDRELDDEQKRLVGFRDLEKWLAELQTQVRYERNLSEEDAVRAIDDVY